MSIWRKPTRTLLLLTTLAAALNLSIVQAATAKARPNFVFILADDLGWKDLGCTGSTFYETPNIDRLAASGMRFTQAYAACQVCSPTRASILTGKCPPRIGVTDYLGAAGPDLWRRPTRLLPAAQADAMPLSEVTLAEALKESGYTTFFAGKWHLGPEGFWPEDQGFDVNRGGCSWGHPKSYFSPYKNPTLEDGPAGEHLPDRLANETVSFIQANRDRPFLAYLSLYSVHTPLQGREDLIAKYQAKAGKLATSGPAWGEEGERKVRLVQDHPVYAAMVEAMDLAIGKVLDALDRMGIAENTVVVFTSDNGGLSTSEGHPTSNAPLRGGKGWFYEGGLRVPLIIRAPGFDSRGTLCNEPVFSPDYYPTFLELAGLPLRRKQHQDGLSLVPLLKGKEQLRRDSIFWHYPHYGNQGGSPGSAMRQRDWKLIEFAEDGHAELYNLRLDPGETNNVAATREKQVAKMRKQLAAWRKQVNAKYPSPNPKVQLPVQ